MIDRFYPKEVNRAKLILGILSEMPRRRVRWCHMILKFCSCVNHQGKVSNPRTWMYNGDGSAETTIVFGAIPFPGTTLYGSVPIVAI
jgi:hypothetical protein